MIEDDFSTPNKHYVFEHIYEGIYLDLKSLGNVAFLMKIGKTQAEGFKFFKVENTNLREQTLIPLQPRSRNLFMKPDENMEFIKEIMQIFGVDINFAQRINSWAWQIDYLEMQDPFTP